MVALVSNQSHRAWVGDVFRNIVAANLHKCRVEAREFLQHRRYVFGLAGAFHPDGQEESNVLIAHVQKLEPAANRPWT